MSCAKFIVLFILPLTDLISCSPIASQHKNDQQLAAEIDPLTLVGSQDSQGDHDDPDKRNWNNLSGMWGKRGWNNLSGAWGKRNNWNNLSGMWGKRGWNNLNGGWGKRNNWNNLSGMWGKRGWNNLSGGWGKRNNWNNLSGMWGKRNNWNNLSGMWGKRLMDEAAVAEENSKRTQWNNLKGMWGKRGDPEWTPEDIYGLPAGDDYQEHEDYQYAERI